MQKKETVINTDPSGDNDAPEKNNEINDSKQTTIERKVRKQLDENLLVPIRSNVTGRLTYKSRTGVDIRFSNIGDEDVITLRDLRTMISSNRSFLEKGWILVLDEEVVDYLNISRIQKNVVDAEDIEHILQLPGDKILKTVNEASANTKSLIFDLAQDKFLNNQLTDYHTIKAIEEGLGQSLDPNN